MRFTYVLLDDLAEHIALCGSIKDRIENFDNLSYLTVDGNELVINATPVNNVIVNNPSSPEHNPITSISFI